MNKQQIITKFHHSKLMRFIFYPINIIYRYILLSKYRKSKDSQYLKQLNNKYSSQRCFIIGNGPSLTPDDLGKIKNEISFASNRIYHIFEFTDWRPTYYISIDTNLLAVEYEKIKKIGNFPKFINYKAAIYGRNIEDNIHYICTKGKFRINSSLPEVSTLSSDISCFVAKVHTVTVTAIEIAIYMGFKEIYLLGVDNNYAKKVDKNGKVYDDPTVKYSYFKGMKDSNGKLGDGISVQSVEAMNYSYKICKEFAEERGVKIYNATRGGKLEIFERVDFDSLFDK